MGRFILVSLLVLLAIPTFMAVVDCADVGGNWKACMKARVGAMVNGPAKNSCTTKASP